MNTKADRAVLHCNIKAGAKAALEEIAARSGRSLTQVIEGLADGGEGFSETQTRQLAALLASNVVERNTGARDALLAAKAEAGAMQALLSEPPPKPRLFDAYFLPEGEGEGQPAPPADTKTIPLWPEQAEQGETGAALEAPGSGPVCQICGTPLAGLQKKLCANKECYNKDHAARKRRERAAKKASGGGA